MENVANGLDKLCAWRGWLYDNELHVADWFDPLIIMGLYMVLKYLLLEEVASSYLTVLLTVLYFGCNARNTFWGPMVN